jgi:SNF2 family DNA or RNA helicase
MTSLLNKNSLFWQNIYTEFCKKNNILIKSHQVEGVIWCVNKELSPDISREEEKDKKRGGVLADEMGMGKTIQMIGVFMLNPVKKTLLIVPPILVAQWSAEIQKFTGHVSTVYYGKNRKNIDLTNPKVIVVITSYETVVRDVSKFKEIAWNRVVCDEAHHLRNPKTQIYGAVQDVLLSNDSQNKATLWMITGTPMHHSPKDICFLYTLFGYSLSELSGEKGMEILRSRFLQRKHQENDLPKKQEHTILIEWTESGERDLAKDIHQTIPFLGFSSLDDEYEPSFWEKKKRPLLVSMIRAKQTCILPKMTEKSYLDTDEVEVEQTIPFLATFDQSTTTKLQEILRLLNSRRENGNGKVIFCHFQLEMAYLLEKLGLDNKETPCTSWVGTWQDYKKITMDNRSILGESPILILQIQSGCEGLNLQAHFSEVYFVSPDWNPTLEEQAIARCWRIGQKKLVEVFRFLMNFVDTPERNFQRRNEVQKYRSLFDPLPFDLQNLISSFLPATDSYSLENARKYSMDQYTFVHSEKKRNRIQLFLSKIA